MSNDPPSDRDRPDSPAGPATGATATPAPPSGAAPGKILSPAAQRALAEAAERRAAIDAKAAALAARREIDGRGGLDPVRYDDWEVKGLTVDF